MSFQIGDGIALGRLAADLYKHGYKVAKTAPTEFSDLLSELWIIRNILYRVCEKLNAQGRANDEIALAALERTGRALEELKPLIRKYECIASTDKRAYVKRIRFAVEKDKIDQSKLDLRNSWNLLYQVIDLPPPEIERMATSPNPSQGSGEALSTVENQPATGQKGETQDDTLVPRVRLTSLQKHKPDTTKGEKLSSSPHDYRQSLQSSTRGSMNGSSSSSARPESTSESHVSSISSNETPPRADRLITLSKQHQDAMSRRLSKRVDRHIKKKVPVFEEHAAPLDMPNAAEKCLSQAVWWLLKSQTVRRALRSHPPDTDWPLETSIGQVNIDLLKSYSITKDILDNRVESEQAIQETHWKTLQDLVTAIDREMAELGSEWNAPRVKTGDDDDDELDLSFEEQLYQPAEFARPYALDTFDEDGPDRWLKVHQADFAVDGDRIIFRTFVDGKIGEPSKSRKSVTAPYLLIMWCNRASSEISVSLLNLAGSVNLCSSLNPEDIDRNQSRQDRPLEFHMKFPSQEHTIIRFLCSDDSHEFSTHAEQFFHATEGRRPKPDEFLVARESLDEFESRPMTDNVRASIGGEAYVTSDGEPCEVSLYEEVPNECWKATRRLVLSSSPVANPLFCFSYWMPISRVQTIQEGKNLTLSWSDFSHLDKINRGNADWRWSYKYNPETPSFTVSLQFQNSEVAGAFQRSILQPFEMPYDFDHIRLCQGFDWVSASAQSTGPKVTVWEMKDKFVSVPQQYIAVNSIERQQETTYVSEMYLLYRDLDFELPGSSQHSIRLFALQVPHYVSDIHNIPSEPDASPKLKEVVHHDSDLTLEFSGDKDIRRFLGSMSSRWIITGFCPAGSLQLIQYRIKAQELVPVIASVWVPESQSDNLSDKVRVAIRHAPNNKSSKEKPRWTTIKISPSVSFEIQGRKIVFKDVVEQCDVHQGETIDIYNFEANTDGTPRRQKGRKLNVKLVFESSDLAYKLYRLVQDAYEDENVSEAALMKTVTNRTRDTVVSPQGSLDFRELGRD
ncbi:MAG: hypothetical protein M1831_007259 [Alyxoria varia]|nr:MAG: hypothetical protein M1831_007259 [Alyxoria varia]